MRDTDAQPDRPVDEHTDICLVVRSNDRVRRGNGGDLFGASLRSPSRNAWNSPPRGFRSIETGWASNDDDDDDRVRQRATAAVAVFANRTRRAIRVRSVFRIGEARAHGGRFSETGCFSDPMPEHDNSLEITTK
mmetsp:Transcript_1947/g.5136  ORF Transcript_1947/g.5136 Transcript_1947/m.5136 type:complete len:134 (+) Transcript_1947:535-936(+)